MEIMAEICFASVGLESDFPRLVPFVTLVTLAGNSECILAVVAGTAGFAFLHACHGCLECSGLVRERFAVTVRALEHADMHLMAEDGISNTLQLEGDLAWLHPLVAVAAVSGHRKSHFAVVTGTTGFPFFHLRHGYAAILAGNNLAVMAASAGKACLGNMCIMAEGYFGCPFHLEGDVAGFSLMTTDTMLLAFDAESLDTAMTGAARLGRLHLRHSVALFMAEVEDGVMTDTTVVTVFFQMEVMAENHRIGIFERERNVLRLFCQRQCRQQENKNKHRIKTT